MVNIQKSVVFLYTNNDLLGRESKKELSKNQERNLEQSKASLTVDKQTVIHPYCRILLLFSR